MDKSTSWQNTSRKFQEVEAGADLHFQFLPRAMFYMVHCFDGYQVVNFEQFSGQKKTLDGFISRVTSQSVSYLVYKESLKARSQLESAMTFGSLAIINFASSDYRRVS